MLGKSTSRVEVTNISQHGFWLLLGDEELFLPFSEFQWFRDVAVGKILHVERPAANHLYRPDLDLELAVESIPIQGDFRWSVVLGLRRNRQAHQRVKPCDQGPLGSQRPRSIHKSWRWRHGARAATRKYPAGARLDERLVGLMQSFP